MFQLVTIYNRKPLSNIRIKLSNICFTQFWILFKESTEKRTSKHSNAEYSTVTKVKFPKQQQLKQMHRTDWKSRSIDEFFCFKRRAQPKHLNRIDAFANFTRRIVVVEWHLVQRIFLANSKQIVKRYTHRLKVKKFETQI